MASKVDFQKVQSNTYEIALSWASGATSASADLNGAKLIGIAYPAMTNSSLTVQKRVSGTFYNAFDSAGTALTMAVSTSAAGYVYLNPVDAASLEDGIRFTTASAEGAARSLIMVVRPL